MNDIEEWREVPETDGWYEVSNQGEVRSWRGNWRSDPSIRSEEPRILQPGTNGNGYLFVQLYPPGAAKRNMRVHQIVTLAFLGPYPEGSEVCHNDGDKLNNHVTNLRYDTHAANLAERTMPRGEQHRSARLSDLDVLEVRRLRAEEAWTLREIAAKFDVAITTVHYICTRKHWVHV